VIRREDGEEMETGDMSAAELMRAIRIQKKLRTAETDEALPATARAEMAAHDPREVPDDDIVQANTAGGPTPFPKTVVR